MSKTTNAQMGLCPDAIWRIISTPSHESVFDLERRACRIAHCAGLTPYALLCSIYARAACPSVKRGFWPHAVLEVVTRRFLIGFGVSARPLNPAIFNALAARSNVDTACEVMQIVAMKFVVKGLFGYDATRPFEPYLAKICENELRAFFRRRKRDQDVGPLPPNDALAMETRRLPPETMTVNLQWILEQLNQRDRNLLEERSVSPARDIARRQKVPVKKVYRMLEAARRRARRLLEQAPGIS